GIDDNLNDEVRITVIATGFEKQYYAGHSSELPRRSAPRTERKEEEGVSVPPLFDGEEKRPVRKAPRPVPAERSESGEAPRPRPRPAATRVNPDTHIPRRTTNTPPTYDSSSTFVEKRHVRRGMTPDKPSFMKNVKSDEMDD
ncbi:MAG: hypothetical protein II920_00825, partial [Clostridia bacterium]|nr:hypothetical protein [Clostridia bacterium]